MLNALGASHAQNIASCRVTCFCEHHQRAAKERGIDLDRAREGYRKLDQFVQAALKAGADGLILSRKHSEMPLANLAAAGRAVRDATRS